MVIHVGRKKSQHYTKHSNRPAQLFNITASISETLAWGSMLTLYALSMLSRIGRKSVHFRGTLNLWLKSQRHE